MPIEWNPHNIPAAQEALYQRGQLIQVLCAFLAALPMNIAQGEKNLNSCFLRAPQAHNRGCGTLWR
jgi:hypothetical protein